MYAKLNQISCKTFVFFFSKHTNSPYRAAKLISMTKCRTMNKMVADTKDCCCLQVPSHLQNLALQYLSFNHGQRHHLHRSVFYKTQSSDQNWKQRLSKKTDITWHHQRFSDPLLLPSLWDISRGGERSFWMAKMQEILIFEDTFLSELTGL